MTSPIKFPNIEHFATDDMSIPMVDSIHPQLLADCHLLGELPHSHVLLHKNAVIPWLIQVPKTKYTDLLDLPEGMRNAVLDEAATLGQIVKTHWQLSKLNIAQLGNMVPQMHLHIIGRSADDACWPNPVWGNLHEERAYTDAEIDAVRNRIFGD